MVTVGPADRHCRHEHTDHDADECVQDSGHTGLGVIGDVNPVSTRAIGVTTSDVSA